MTFWDFLAGLGKLIWNNLTKILGFLQVTVGYLCTASIIPDKSMKYWLATSGLLTIWLGFGNTNKIANAVVEKHAANAAQAAQDAQVPFVPHQEKLP